MASPRRVEKAKLPRLRPNVNRRAQQIISAHMQLEDQGGTLSSSIPVLSKLDRTAPKTARTHDVSHLADHRGGLAPCLPASFIKEEDYVYESSFMPSDVTSSYSEEDGLWHTKVFPSQSPSSRRDAVMLDNWISKTLGEIHESLQESQRSREEFADTVQELVPVLSVALHEIVRQVMHHCRERGVALQKIWRTYVELFERVLQQMQQSIKVHKEHTEAVQEQLHQANQEAKQLKREYPEQMQHVISELEATFLQRQKQFEQELQEAEEENGATKTALQAQHKAMESWFPGFQLYQDSSVRSLLPPESASTLKESTEAPEMAIAEDFKRLLEALPVEQRRIIGQDLMGLIDGVERVSMEEKPVDPEEHEQLERELMEQEEQIKQLKAQIAREKAEDEDTEGDEEEDSDGETHHT